MHYGINRKKRAGGMMESDNTAGVKIENRKTMRSEMRMKSGKESRVGGGHGGRNA